MCIITIISIYAHFDLVIMIKLLEFSWNAESAMSCQLHKCFVGSYGGPGDLVIAM